MKNRTALIVLVIALATLIAWHFIDVNGVVQ